jgi:hypothetical protein
VGICGSDLEAYRGSRAPEFMTTPARLGHEVAGVLDKVGDKKAWEAWVQKNAPRMSKANQDKIVKMIRSRRASLDIKIKDAEEALDRAKAAAKAAKIKPKKVKPGPMAKPNAEATLWQNDAEIARVNAEIDKQYGAAYRLGLEKKIQDVLDDPDVLLLRNEKLSTLLQHFMGREANGGPPRFKSQQETGTSQGCLNPAHRKKVETWLFRLFGKWVKRKEDAAIYGWVQTRKELMAGANHASWYGDVSCVIKKSERYRITGSGGDSLGKGFVPMALDKPGPAMLGTYVDKRSLDMFASSGLKSRHSYFELQVHGQLSIEDIEEFIVFSQQAARDLAPLAKKYGIKITVK